jgi:hypothetical protein
LQQTAAPTVGSRGLRQAGAAAAELGRSAKGGRMSGTVTGFHEQTTLAWPPGVQPEDCVVIFDGVCKFCDRSVQFLLRHERHPVLRFSATQSTTGSALLAHFGLLTDAQSTVVLIERGKAYGKSDAALRLSRWPEVPGHCFLPYPGTGEGLP